MKTLLTHAVLLASLTGVAALFASNQPATEPRSEDRRAEEEVRRLNLEENQAFLDKDSKT
jgi:hypothetical protein